MEIHQDFKELLESLNAENVDYLVVGAHALAHHGTPRFTGDLDVYVCPDPENARRVIRALEAFGLGSMGFTPEDFSSPDNIIQLGVHPVRVDIMTSITGVSWEQAAAGRETGECGGVPVTFIGKRELVANKRTLGRAKDLADLEAIGED